MCLDGEGEFCVLLGKKTWRTGKCLLIALVTN